MERGHRDDRPRRASPASASAASPSGWVSGSASPPRCSATRRPCILDEPVNGLDPEGVLWVRTLMRELAAQGRTVFLSSHLMSEMALTADHIVVIGRGRILADAGVADIIARSGGNTVVVRSPQATRLVELLRGPDVDVHRDRTRRRRGHRHHRGGHRRGRGRGRHRAARARPPRRHARGLLHVADRRTRSSTTPRRFRPRRRRPPSRRSSCDDHPDQRRHRQHQRSTPLRPWRDVPARRALRMDQVLVAPLDRLDPRRDRRPDGRRQLPRGLLHRT